MTKTNQNIEDSILIELLRKDPRKAIAGILEKYGAALYGSVLKIAHSPEVAEDLMQEAAVKIWKNAASYDQQKGKLFTWLLNIVRNTALDKVRTQKFQRTRKSETLEETVYNEVNHSEEMQIEDVGLRRTLQQLDEKYREVIDLLYLQGYTQREATEALDIPLGTVKSRAKIAIRKLRNLLNDKVLWWIYIFIHDIL